MVTFQRKNQICPNRGVLSGQGALTRRALTGRALTGRALSGQLLFLFSNTGIKMSYLYFQAEYRNRNHKVRPEIEYVDARSINLSDQKHISCASLHFPQSIRLTPKISKGHFRIQQYLKKIIISVNCV